MSFVPNLFVHMQRLECAQSHTYNIIFGSSLDCETIWAVRALIRKWSPQWAVTASRSFLNFWRTSHWTQDVHRDSRVSACADAVASMGQYLVCMLLRYLLSAF